VFFYESSDDGAILCALARDNDGDAANLQTAVDFLIAVVYYLNSNPLQTTAAIRHGRIMPTK
jgi:hypothetical protein